MQGSAIKPKIKVSYSKRCVHVHIPNAFTGRRYYWIIASDNSGDEPICVYRVGVHGNTSAIVAIREVGCLFYSEKPAEWGNSLGIICSIQLINTNPFLMLKHPCPVRGTLSGRADGIGV